MKKLLYLFLLSLVAIFVASCGKDQMTIDREIILKYIDDNNLTAYEDSATGVFYTITNPGSGTHPNLLNQVTVAYTGYLADGTIFDMSSAAGVTFNLNGVIQGWRIGIPKYGVGGRGKLLIPSVAGYGSNSQQGIPANSVLIFDIHLIDIQ